MGQEACPSLLVTMKAFRLLTMSRPSLKVSLPPNWRRHIGVVCKAFREGADKWDRKSRSALVARMPGAVMLRSRALRRLPVIRFPGDEVWELASRGRAIHLVTWMVTTNENFRCDNRAPKSSRDFLFRIPD